MADGDFATTDLCDAHEAQLASGEVLVIQPALLRFGARRAFHGQAVTLKLFEDNSLLAEAVRSPGAGRVLVVDAGGSTRCAVLGGNLAKAAATSGWAAVIVNGAVRDADEIDACAIAVLALALSPRRSAKRGIGERDVAVNFLGVTIRPGDWIYGDRDGTLVSRSRLHT
jgi:regulator of ribonuclease activity A